MGQSSGNHQTMLLESRLANIWIATFPRKASEQGRARQAHKPVLGSERAPSLPLVPAAALLASAPLLSATPRVAELFFFHNIQVAILFGFWCFSVPTECPRCQRGFTPCGILP